MNQTHWNLDIVETLNVMNYLVKQSEETKFYSYPSQNRNVLIFIFRKINKK